MTILQIDASPRYDASVTRALTKDIVSQIGGDVITRDLADGIPFVDSDWAAAKGTKADELTKEQEDTLAFSDTLIQELQSADTIVIGLPVYNFMIPANLKAWIDMVARAGKTFKYSEDGPKGLLDGKRAIVAVASGGTKVGSDIDFATPYMTFALKFIGITDVTYIAADSLGDGGDKKIAEAKTQIANLA